MDNINELKKTDAEILEDISCRMKINIAEMQKAIVILRKELEEKERNETFRNR